MFIRNTLNRCTQLPKFVVNSSKHALQDKANMNVSRVKNALFTQNQSFHRSNHFNRKVTTSPFKNPYLKPVPFIALGLSLTSFALYTMTYAQNAENSQKSQGNTAENLTNSILGEDHPLFIQINKVRSFSEVSQIIEIVKAKFIENTEFKILVVLDLDETAIRPRTSLGTEADLRRRKKLLEEGRGIEKSRQEIFDTIDAIRAVVPFGPTEYDLPQRLERHQEECDMIGCTSRVITATNNAREVTQRNLKEANIALKEVLHYDKVTKEHKGIMIQKYLVGKNYAFVIFVDDGKDNVENVFKTLKGRVVVLHYVPEERPLNMACLEQQQIAFAAGQPVPTDEELIARV